MMIIMTNKRYKKDRAIACGVLGATGAVGLAGTTIGTIALVKTTNLKKHVDSIHTDLERRMSAEEGMTRQFTKAVSQIQDVLEKNDILRQKR